MSGTCSSFVCPIDDAILARYELAGAEGGQTSIQELTESPGQATRSVSVNGMRARITAASSRVGAAENRAAAQMSELTDALVRFQQEHHGVPPKDAEELRPYVKNPEVLARYRPRPGN